MNKKGFSLIEILAVVAIIGVIGLMGGIALDKVLDNSKSDRYFIMVNELEQATDTYITIYEAELSASLGALYNSSISFNVKVKDLQDALLIDEPLIDPRNGKIIDGDTTRVTIAYSSNELTFSLGEITYE